MKARGFQIMQLGRDRSRDMTDFVYETYRARFQNHDLLDYDDYVQMAIEDRFTLNSSAIFAAVADGGRTLGCLRVIERRGPLPAEKEFGFDALQEFRRHFPDRPAARRVYEIGRFATSLANLKASKLPKSLSIHITDCLLRAMFGHVTRDPDSFGVASLDVTTLRILRMRGMQVKVIGQARDYLGSPTVPVVLCADACLEDLRHQRPEQYAFMTGQDARRESA